MVLDSSADSRVRQLSLSFAYYTSSGPKRNKSKPRNVFYSTTNRNAVPHQCIVSRRRFLDEFLVFGATGRMHPTWNNKNKKPQSIKQRELNMLMPPHKTQTTSLTFQMVSNLAQIW
ncbi:unnamed protein product [Ectocarpus sp. 8 AP-2014]